MSLSSDAAVCRKKEAESPPSLFQNGKIVIQAHHIGWIITGFFTIVATAVSFWLVNKHLQWYTNKREQRYIVRILFMVPLYAIISLASYLWWNHATPIILIRDGYESTVLTAFFYLLLMYLSPDSEEQRSIFMKYGLSRERDAEKLKKGEQPQRWVFPLGFIKWKPTNGLYFLQLMKWGILQYCVLRPLTTLIAVILDYMGLYCESSWGLGWGHPYIVIIVSLSVTVAMYCLIQLYVSVSKDLAKHKPLLKLFAIKAVVFLTFWQATFLSVLSLFGVVKDTQYMTADDINIGIGALLETFEMALFAFLHIRAFTYKPYQHPQGQESDLLSPTRTPRLKSLGHAMDFRETFRELWVGCVYMWHKYRGKEPRLDVGAIRTAHYEGVFGKQRPSRVRENISDNELDKDDINLKQPTLPKVQVGVDERFEVDIAGEKQWLGTGDDYGYGLKFLRKERSEGLEDQIESELKKRGYTLRNDEVDLQLPRHPKQKSWWRSIYNRISQTGRDEVHQVEEEQSTLNPTRAQSRSRTGRRSRSRRVSRDGYLGRSLLLPSDADQPELDDHPPSSVLLRKNRHDLQRSVDQWRQTVNPTYGTEDVLMPLPVPVSGHGYQPRDDLADVSGSSPAAVKPRQYKPQISPNFEGHLDRMFKNAVNDPPRQYSQAPTDTARSEISSAEGYRLAKSTPPVQFVPSQPVIIPADQLAVGGERRTTLYHLADGNDHVSMAADIISVRSVEQRNDPFLASPGQTHGRDSTNHGPSPVSPPDPNTTPLPPAGPLAIIHEQPQAGPSRSSRRSTPGLRRSSAQYYTSRPSSRQRLSLQTPPTTLTSFNGGQSHRTSPPGGSHVLDESSPTHPFPVTPMPTSPPRNHSLPSTPRSPISPIDDGLSRYPPHFLPAHQSRPRRSRPTTKRNESLTPH